jgi:hypothetical protein
MSRRADDHAPHEDRPARQLAGSATRDVRPAHDVLGRGGAGADPNETRNAKTDQAGNMPVDVGRLLEPYRSGRADLSSQALEHFPQVAQCAPPELLRKGLVAMLRSERTLPFARVAGQIFGHANAGQRLALLERLMSSLPPGASSMQLAGSGCAALIGGAGQLASGQGWVTLEPGRTRPLSVQQVQEIAARAQRHDPGVIDAVGGFLADHPVLAKTLGGAALSIALAKMADRRRH